jgi:hypothetical protein
MNTDLWLLGDRDAREEWHVRYQDPRLSTVADDINELENTFCLDVQDPSCNAIIKQIPGCIGHDKMQRRNDPPLFQYRIT